MSLDVSAKPGAIQSEGIEGIEDIEHIVRTVERVYAMTLTGVPRTVIVDAAAIWSTGASDDLIGAVIGKLGLLAQQNGMRITVRDVEPWQAAMLEAAIPRLHLRLEWHVAGTEQRSPLAEQAPASEAAVAVLATADQAPPESWTAFYVAAGQPPRGAHATQLTGARATNAILGLYGTALVQERAGLAFRDISAGKSIPRTAPAAPESLAGVVRAVERPAAHTPADRGVLPDQQTLRALAARAYGQLLRNVLPNGAVVGSPARGNEPGQPNYWFYWQRDGSVTMGHLIEWHRQPPLGLDTASLGGAIEQYVGFIAQTQRRGQLGTSRYTVDGQPITGFGNPQLDGPPLSAMTLARVARMEQSAQVWERMRAYLDFLLSPAGRGPSMDAWEFIYGWHFNAAYLKRQALRIGATVATRAGHADDAARYLAEAQHVETELGTYVDQRLGRLRAFGKTYNAWFAQMSGLDMAIIVALLSGRDLYARGHDSAPEAGRAARLGQDYDSLAHPAVLATMNALEDAFASAYPCNRVWTAAGNAGFGLGRFPEDANDGVGTSGGNPWPLATLWAAQFYYYLAEEIARKLQDAGEQAITLYDERQVAFLQRALKTVSEHAIPIEAGTWREMVLPALLARGDGYLSFVIHHMPAEGGVTEQIDRDTGAPRGARDLSWALSELIATIALREQAASGG